jgi:hypothetical protein
VATRFRPDRRIARRSRTTSTASQAEPDPSRPPTTEADKFALPPLTGGLILGLLAPRRIAIAIQIAFFAIAAVALTASAPDHGGSYTDAFWIIPVLALLSAATLVISGAIGRKIVQAGRVLSEVQSHVHVADHDERLNPTIREASSWRVASAIGTQPRTASVRANAQRPAMKQSAVAHRTEAGGRSWRRIAPFWDAIGAVLVF